MALKLQDYIISLEILEVLKFLPLPLPGQSYRLYLSQTLLILNSTIHIARFTLPKFFKAHHCAGVGGRGMCEHKFVHLNGVHSTPGFGDK